MVIDSFARYHNGENGLPPIDPSTIHLVLLLEDISRNKFTECLKAFPTSQTKLPVIDHSQSTNSVVQSENDSTSPSLLEAKVKRSVISAPPDVLLNSSASSSSARVSASAPYSLPEERLLAKGRSRNTKSSGHIRKRNKIPKVPITDPVVDRFITMKMKVLTVPFVPSPKST